ncbi:MULTISPECIES: class I SAM-dependent methyltransferase [unclassified Microcoleus]|uniref:class I SAM-dependent methyltransferase n=1 Tax=unclassified Microcoleus TaxID=2642155 RepID=UPI002FD73E63
MRSRVWLRVSVGGNPRLSQRRWENLTVSAETKVLDRCCGSGQTKQFLVQYFQDVTGLDASPLSLQGARKNVPSANYYLKAFADCQFDRSTQQRCDARNAIGHSCDCDKSFKKCTARSIPVVYSFW